MSKEYYKQCIVNKRLEKEKLNDRVRYLREQKSKKIQSLRTILNNAQPVNKLYYRRQIISETARYDKDIDSLKKQIEQVNKSIDNYKKSLASAK